MAVIDTTTFENLQYVEGPVRALDEYVAAGIYLTDQQQIQDVVERFKLALLYSGNREAAFGRVLAYCIGETDQDGVFVPRDFDSSVLPGLKADLVEVGSQQPHLYADFGKLPLREVMWRAEEAPYVHPLLGKVARMHELTAVEACVPLTDNTLPEAAYISYHFSLTPVEDKQAKQ